jgi:hypothetical protein
MYLFNLGIFGITTLLNFLYKLIEEVIGINLDKNVFI